MSRGVSLTNDMELHKRYRRFYAHVLNARAAQEYNRVMLLETRKYLSRVLTGPASLRENIVGYINFLYCQPLLEHALMYGSVRTVGSSVFMLVYGYQMSSNDDPLIKLAHKTSDNFVRGSYRKLSVTYLHCLPRTPALAPGAYLVDTVPFCSRSLCDSEPRN